MSNKAKTAPVDAHCRVSCQSSRKRVTCSVHSTYMVNVLGLFIARKLPFADDEFIKLNGLEIRTFK